MNEIQRIFAKRIIPLNIRHVEEHIPELHCKISDLKRLLESLASDIKRRDEK